MENFDKAKEISSKAKKSNKEEIKLQKDSVNDKKHEHNCCEDENCCKDEHCCGHTHSGHTHNCCGKRSIVDRILKYIFMGIISIALISCTFLVGFIFKNQVDAQKSKLDIYAIEQQIAHDVVNKQNSAITYDKALEIVMGSSQISVFDNGHSAKIAGDVQIGQQELVFVYFYHNGSLTYHVIEMQSSQANNFLV